DPLLAGHGGDLGLVEERAEREVEGTDAHADAEGADLDAKEPPDDELRDGAVALAVQRLEAEEAVLVAPADGGVALDHAPGLDARRAALGSDAGDGAGGEERGGEGGREEGSGSHRRVGGSRTGRRPDPGSLQGRSVRAEARFYASPGGLVSPAPVTE